MATLNKLQEIENIKQLKARYCRFIDTKNWEGLGSLLTEDAQLTFKDPSGAVIFQFQSRQEMLGLTVPMLQNAVTIHQVHQPEIEIISDSEANAKWALEDHVIFPEDAEGAPYRSMHGFGIYHDNLIKTGEVWQISSFILERLKLDINL